MKTTDDVFTLLEILLTLIFIISVIRVLTGYLFSWVASSESEFGLEDGW